MYALMVTFHLKGSTDDLKPLLASYSRSLDDCPGHVDHIWLQDGEEMTLLHLFEDEATLKRYLSCGLIATLTAHPACTGRAFTRRFQVLSASEREALQPRRTNEMSPPGVAIASRALAV